MVRSGGARQACRAADAPDVIGDGVGLTGAALRAGTPPEQHRGLARRQAEEHGQGSAGTWANILSTARRHLEDAAAPADSSAGVQAP